MLKIVTGAHSQFILKILTGAYSQFIPRKIGKELPIKGAQYYRFHRKAKSLQYGKTGTVQTNQSVSKQHQQSHDLL